MKRPAILICSFLLLAQVAQTFKGNGPCSREGTVTIHEREQDIAQILSTVAEQTHLTIVVSPDLHQVVSADFDCQDVRYVLDALAVAADARYRIDGEDVRIFPKRRPTYVAISN
jgi:type II secretory pathway component GspD/PulD (secretin)